MAGKDRFGKDKVGDFAHKEYQTEATEGQGRGFGYRNTSSELRHAREYGAGDPQDDLTNEEYIQRDNDRIARDMKRNSSPTEEEHAAWVQGQANLKTHGTTRADVSNYNPDPNFPGPSMDSAEGRARELGQTDEIIPIPTQTSEEFISQPGLGSQSGLGKGYKAGE